MTSEREPDIEAVVGFSLYPQAIWDPGRSYLRESTSGVDWVLERLGLYVGIGLLDSKKTIADGFQSVYYGVELEVAQDFSIAVGRVLRQVEVLSGGARVGDELGVSGEVPKKESFEHGFGVVLNLSHGFFKIAAKGLAGV